MNKYQSFILSQTVCFVSKDFSTTSRTSALSLIENEDELVIKQDENYNIKKHNLCLSGVTIAFAELDGKRYEPTDFESNGFSDQKMIVIPINFDSRANNLLLNLGEFADPLTLKLKYVEADRQAYDAKIAEEVRVQRTRIANIKVSTGADLVNIYFQPCCETYARTEVVLFRDNMMLAKYKVDEDTFFKSIGGLAYGTYEFTLKQLDSSGNVVLETDRISFTLSRLNYSGGHTVVI